MCFCMFLYHLKKKHGPKICHIYQHTYPPESSGVWNLSPQISPTKRTDLGALPLGAEISHPKFENLTGSIPSTSTPCSSESACTNTPVDQIDSKTDQKLQGQKHRGWPEINQWWRPLWKLSHRIHGTIVYQTGWLIFSGFHVGIQSSHGWYGPGLGLVSLNFRPAIK